MKQRIVKITNSDGSVSYRCERTGFFRRKTWRPIVIQQGNGFVEWDEIAEFRSMPEALRFLGVDKPKVVKEECVYEV